MFLTVYDERFEKQPTVETMYKRQHLLWSICSCSLIIWAGTQTWAYQEEPSKPVGLTGLLASYAPDGLEPEDFEKLSEEIDETWKDWTVETGQFVTELYEGEHSTVAEQRSVIEKLRIKLVTMEKALADSRYSSIHTQISLLYGMLLPRVDMAEAVLNTLTVDEDAALRARTADAEKKLQAAIRDFRRDMSIVQGGRPWLSWAKIDSLASFSPTNADSIAAVNSVKARIEKREEYGPEIQKFLSRETFLELEDALAGIQTATAPVESKDLTELREMLGKFLETIDDYDDDPTPELAKSLREQFDAIRLSAPDGGTAISDAFAGHFLNYNLRVAVSEGFLNRMVSEARNQSSRINTVMGGARVVGNQTSDASLSVDVVGSNRNAEFDLVLNGVVRTSSTAYASQASVQTSGYHTFLARKPVFFDGQQFTTQPAEISVRANNRPVGISTQYSGTLFEGMANRRAWSEASARMGSANAQTAANIRQEVASELNQEVDNRFTKASLDLQKRLYGPLREYGLYPNVMRHTSSNTELRIWTRLSDDDEIAGSRPVPGIAAPEKGLVAYIHESLLSNSTNRLGLGTEDKMQMTDGELRALLQERLSRILDREIDLGMSEDDGEPATFVFDQADPIRFKVAGGEVVITMRAGLNRGNEVIPTQMITVPLMPSVEGDKIVLKRGNVAVRPVERVSSPAEQIARANVMRQKIQSAIPEKEYDAGFEFKQEQKSVKLKVTSITAENGWLAVTIE